MLDLTGLPALDLAIGLAFIFFLLATLALTIQEFIAAILGLRARTLEQGLRSLLEDPTAGWRYVDKFYDHPLIKSLYRTPPPAVVKEAGAKSAAKAEEKREAPDEVAADVGKNAHTQSLGAVPARAGVLQADQGSVLHLSAFLRARGARQLRARGRPRDLLRPGDEGPRRTARGPSAATQAAHRRPAEGRREAADQPRSVLRRHDGPGVGLVQAQDADHPARDRLPHGARDQREHDLDGRAHVEGRHRPLGGRRTGSGEREGRRRRSTTPPMASTRSSRSASRSGGAATRCPMAPTGSRWRSAVGC